MEYTFKYVLPSFSVRMLIMGNNANINNEIIFQYCKTRLNH